MDVDWDAVSSGNDLGTIHEPAALFDALPNKQPGLGYLRQVQATVLERWSPRREESDLVIKMNTGTGKTIVGLLILQTSLHDGAGPALFLAPTPHLAERAAEEGRRLGLAIVTDPTSAKFGSGEAICVTTLQTMFNGKTRFGLAESGAALQVGTIIIDDAHSAITRLEEYSRAVIPKDDPARARPGPVRHRATHSRRNSRCHGQRRRPRSELGARAGVVRGRQRNRLRLQADRRRRRPAPGRRGRPRRHREPVRRHRPA